MPSRSCVTPNMMDILYALLASTVFLGKTNCRDCSFNACGIVKKFVCTDDNSSRLSALLVIILELMLVRHSNNFGTGSRFAWFCTVTNIVFGQGIFHNFTILFSWIAMRNNFFPVEPPASWVTPPWQFLPHHMVIIISLTRQFANFSRQLLGGDASCGASHLILSGWFFF